MSKRKVIVRADGNSQIGLGHIYRSLALADMLRDEFDCTFFIKSPDKNIVDLIQQHCNVYGISEDVLLQQEPELLKAHIDKDTIVILDGYHFNSEYQKKLKGFSKLLIAVDDMASIHFYADLIINHGDASIIKAYKKESYSKVLAGFSYSILRQEFMDAAKAKRAIEKIDSLFVCLGGADPFNITNKIVRAALECNYLSKIIIVTGSAYRHTAELGVLIAKAAKTIIHESTVTAERMVALIQQCQVAVSTASSISIEICSVRAGLLTGMVVDNQEAIYKQLVENGCALGVKDLNKATEVELKAMLGQLNDIILVNELIHNQTQVIDGHSGQRIITEIKKLAA